MNRALSRQPVIEPQGEGRSALWIYKAAGRTAGMGDYFQYQDEEDYLRQQLGPVGCQPRGSKASEATPICRKAESDGLFNWNTPSGKIEIEFRYTGQKPGFAGVPVWEEPPAPGENGQFYLLTGKVAQPNPVWHAEQQLLHKYSDEPRACG